jgi:hypothetical protein
MRLSWPLVHFNEKYSFNYESKSIRPCKLRPGACGFGRRDHRHTLQSASCSTSPRSHFRVVPDWRTLRDVAPRSANAPREGGKWSQAVVSVCPRVHGGWVLQCDAIGGRTRDDRSMVGKGSSAGSLLLLHWHYCCGLGGKGVGMACLSPA